ncbi:MAG: hypothetical protein IJK63_04200 [Oscillospiraceae bacterium]|nr:hypothetical protein [Oscillospiraceae bacterium]
MGLLDTVIILINIIACLIFIASEAFFHVFFIQSEHKFTISKFFWGQERLCNIFRYIYIFFAILVIILYLYFHLLIFPALLSVLPLFLCVYQLLFRFNFHSVSDIFIAISTILIYTCSFTILDEPDKLFNQLDGTSYAIIVSSISPYISSGILIGIILKILEEAGKSWISHSARISAGVESGKQTRFQQSRQIILSNRHHGFTRVAIFIILLVIVEIVYFVIEENGKTPGFPFRAYVVLLSALLSTLGLVLSAYMTDEALLNAELAYIDLKSSQLCKPLSDKLYSSRQTHYNKILTRQNCSRDQLNSIDESIKSFGLNYKQSLFGWFIISYYKTCSLIFSKLYDLSCFHSKLYSKLLSFHNKPAQNNTFLWEDFCQTFFHICYSTKDIASNS